MNWMPSETNPDPDLVARHIATAKAERKEFDRRRAFGMMLLFFLIAAPYCVISAIVTEQLTPAHDNLPEDYLFFHQGFFWINSSIATALCLCALGFAIGGVLRPVRTWHAIITGLAVATMSILAIGSLLFEQSEPNDRLTPSIHQLSVANTGGAVAGHLAAGALVFLVLGWLALKNPDSGRSEKESYEAETVSQWGQSTSGWTLDRFNIAWGLSTGLLMYAAGFLLFILFPLAAAGFFLFIFAPGLHWKKLERMHHGNQRTNVGYVVGMPIAAFHVQGLLSLLVTLGLSRSF